MLNVKKMIYNILESIGLPFSDNPIVEQKYYPYALFRLNDKQVIRYKNYKEVLWNFKIDIFSSYPGEKECLDWFDVIDSAIFNQLMVEDKIAYVQTSTLLLDDKEQGPVTKHGVFSITVSVLEENDE